MAYGYLLRAAKIGKGANKRGTNGMVNHQTREEWWRAARETPIKPNLESIELMFHLKVSNQSTNREGAYNSNEQVVRQKAAQMGWAMRISKHFLLAGVAGFAFLAISARAQDVEVDGFLSFVSQGSGVFDYTLTLQNTGSEAIEGLWLGWALSSNPTFDIDSPTNGGSALGWTASIDSDSIQFGGSSSETVLAAGMSTTFTFHSTSTPAQFMSQAAGQSVAYGVDASQFAIEDDSLHSIEFAPEVVSVPEPSTFGLLVAAALGILCLPWRSQVRVPSYS